MEPRDQASALDELWIQQASMGDLDAFNQLVLAHQDMLYNHAFSLVGDSGLAEDVTQESFIKAFQAMRQFRGGSFRGWLLKIATNSALDMLRRTVRHPTQPLFSEDENGQEWDSAPWLADPAQSVQDAVEQHELSSELHLLLNDLPDAYRSVILLVDLNDLDYAEAAQVLQVPIGTVKSRLARARLQLQRRLKDKLTFGTCTAGCLAA